MSPEKQRIIIAEASKKIRLIDDGINFITQSYSPNHGQWFTERVGSRTDQERSAFVRLCPDYLNSLDAMHEAEQVLDAGQLVDYVKHLATIHPTFCVDVLDDRDPDGDWHYEMSFLITATAEHRADAFIRTLNKWED